MLIKLLPEQVTRQWNEVKDMIEVSLPPIVGSQSDRMGNILRAILLEELIVWMSVDKEDSAIEGLLITTRLEDKISGTSSLLIYCIYGYGSMEKQSWLEGAETLKKYAISMNCNRIIGYTDVRSLIDLTIRLGGEARYTFISLPLV